MLQSIALYLSLFMAILLFAYAYVEGLRIADSNEKVYGGTFIFTVVFGFIFSRLSYVFL
jgi:hypothetical protein